MPIIAMNTDNPLGQRPFGAMGGLAGTWDLAEQDRSWIVRDTASAPIERMRVPPELLNGLDATVPGTVVLYRPGPAPFFMEGFGNYDGMGREDAHWDREMLSSANPARAIYHDSTLGPVVSDIRPVPPNGTSVQSLLTPGGTASPPVVPVVAHQEPTFAQIVPTGSPIVALGPGSTQNLIPVSTAAQQAAPSLLSIVAGGQPASQAASISPSWFTDPAQEVFQGVPNVLMLAAAAAVVAIMSSKGKSTR